jgi:hypothetical protein
MSSMPNGHRHSLLRSEAGPVGLHAEALWLPAVACLLLGGAGFLAFTSPPGEYVRPAKGRNLSATLPQSNPEEPSPEPVAVADLDEPQREPLWLIALTFFIVLGVGLLLIFYADLPISALV